ncbi:class I SAM-dependent methyltransferase [Microbacterium sp. GXS0129]|uniref:class I SAM-dependent methyltransferase n=1 Tax=Microbacterium sp. GXS0129 TaxID=3377836 RepID=UPI003839DC1F
MSTEAARWDERYTEHPDLFGAAPAWMCERLAELPPASPVLDVGAGQGRVSLAAARLGHIVTAVDLSPVAIDGLRDAATSEGLAIETHVADAVVWLQEARTRSWGVALLQSVSTGSSVSDRALFALLRQHCDGILAEVIERVIPADLVRESWPNAHIERAIAKLPVLRITG